MYSFDKALAWISYLLVTICLLTAPWLFGAWEAWHFWPFATLLFLSAFTFSLRLFLKAYRAEMFGRGKWRPASSAGNMVRAGFLAYALFLSYAFVRFLTTEVHADAERSFLMFLTPCLVAAQVIFSFTSRQNHSLFWMIAVNLILLGLYGIINHIFFHNEYTMWLPGAPQYQIGFFRATGSYVCPDHFSGIMEFTLGTGLSLILARGIHPLLRLGGTAASLLALSGVYFSKSRGGGLTVVIMLAVCLLACLFTWPRKQRWILRASVTACAAAGLAVFIFTDNSFNRRFSDTFGFNQAKHKPFPEAVQVMTDHFKFDARGIMYSAAWRAWKTAPVFGIGAGMHQNLWPHFAASPDGNRKTSDWPTQINNQWYSYAVHNDWLQLLEEYGITGFALFLLPFGCTLAALMTLRRKLAAAENERGPLPSVMLNSAILAFAAMSFHSLGDFNLQMPATAWMLAALIAFPLQQTVYSGISGKKDPDEDQDFES